MIIYLITNKVNNKKYVGQHCGGKDARWKQHLAEALKRQNPKPLYSAMRKYGIDNFTYQVLEEIPLNMGQKYLDDREIHYIKECNTHIENDKGYNLTWGGQGSMVTYCSTQASEKLSDSLDKTDYGVYDAITGQLLKIYDKLKDASAENSIRNPGTIPTTAKYNKTKLNDGNYKTLNGYVWLSRKNNETFPNLIKPLNRKVRTITRKTKKEYNTEIAQFALTGLLVHVWDEPPRDVANSASIPYSSLLKALRGDQKIVNGYFWRRFPKGKTPDRIEDKIEDHVINLSKRQLTTYPVLKFVEGREVMRYPSAMDAIIDSNNKPTKVLDSLSFGTIDDSGVEWRWVNPPQEIK
jgi:group I intron endonuclease